jgi:lipoate-protein ligase A
VLNYSLILRIDGSRPCQSIPATNRFVLERHRDALAALVMAPVEWRGQTDLAIGGLKFCGNAQRRRRNFLLFHGSFLLHLDISLVEKALPLPSRQPEYRVNRSHTDFLINLNVPPLTLKDALTKTWNTDGVLDPLPWDQANRYAREKYALDEWNLKF